MLSFEELTDARLTLQRFCQLHVSSLLVLKSGISFKLHPTEADRPLDEAHHLTTSATCVSSLLDCPRRFRTVDFDGDDLRNKFSQGALIRTDWTSDSSADVYCRCRTLPTILRSSSTTLDRGKIKAHVSTILNQLRLKPDRFGVGEAGSESMKEWYPPNAFHTYWALEILRLLRERFPDEYGSLSTTDNFNLARVSDGMLLWARQQLGYQIGLHSPEPRSSVLDSDQLAWSLAVFLEFDKKVYVNLEYRDFIKQAFKCLFSTQVDGTWRHYKPLFHYQDAGNAYCYVFETFSALLQCALREDAEAAMVRDILKSHCSNLLDLWRYADSTKIDLWRGVDKKGWPDAATGRKSDGVPDTGQT